MIKLTEQQVDKIRSLRPQSDSVCKYNVIRWAGLDDEHKNTIRDFEGKEITRQDIISAYEDYFEDRSVGYMKAFLLTMIWGFGEVGYGTYRTKEYLLIEQKAKLIEKALEYINESNDDSLKNAFLELKKIKGLGVSYLTKILYFATRGKNIEKYALIFDIRVATALVKLTTPKEIYEIVEIAPSSKFEHYKSYVTLIHELAKVNSIEPDQLEMYLFDLKFD